MRSLLQLHSLVVAIEEERSLGAIPIKLIKEMRLKVPRPIIKGHSDAAILGASRVDWCSLHASREAFKGSGAC